MLCHGHRDRRLWTRAPLRSFQDGAQHSVEKGTVSGAEVFRPLQNCYRFLNGCGVTQVRSVFNPVSHCAVRRTLSNFGEKRPWLGPSGLPAVPPRERRRDSYSDCSGHGLRMGMCGCGRKRGLVRNSVDVVGKESSERSNSHG